MKAKLLILSYFAIASLHAADPAIENSKDSSADNQLRQGLFEEEANQNHEKAGTHYRAVLDAYQRHRTMAATATFRLGELARKADDQAAAATAFRAVLEQFPDQEKIAQLSRENLKALGITEPVQGDAAADSTDGEQTAEITRLKQLITKSPDLLNAADVNGWRPIHHAAAKGWIHLIDFLAESGGDVNMRTTKENATALHIATGQGRLDAVQKLLAAKADPKLEFLASEEAFAALGFPSIDPEEMKTIRSASALDVSILCDYRKIARFLTKPSPESAVFVPQSLDDTDINLIGIRLAIRLGRNALAKELIDAGVPINQKISDPAAGKQHQSLLFYALVNGNTAFALVLLDAGADPKLGKNPIFAAFEGYRRHHGKNLNTQGYKLKSDPASYIEMVKRLIKAGTDVNEVDANGSAPIHKVYDKVYEPEMIEILIANGANPNLKNAQGKTPLDLVVASNNRKLMRILLKHGATSDDPMALIETPYFWLRPCLREELLYPKMHREVEGNGKAIHLVVDARFPAPGETYYLETTEFRIVATATSPDSAAPTITGEWLKEIDGKFKNDSIRIMRLGAEGRFSSVHERKFKDGEAFPTDWPKLQWGDIIEVKVVEK